MNHERLALFTDLYELKMLEAYLREGMAGEALFTVFIRRLPPSRNFFLACGLETVLDFLENVRFEEADLDYLASLGSFSHPLLESLRGFRFAGEVRAVPEGTPVFANEPILEIRAPIAQAQIVETFVTNQLHLQTLLASKAARVVLAAQGRPVVDFGARRMHGIDAAVKAARRRRMCSRDSATDSRSRARWRIATFRRTTTSAKPSAHSHAPIPTRRCSSIPMTRLKVSGTSLRFRASLEMTSK